MTDAPKEHCKHCGNEVERIPGKVIARGKLPTHRHVTKVDCPRWGNPLYPEDVQ